MSIRTKLIIVFFLISLIPMSWIGILAYITISNEITSVTINQLSTALSKQEQKLDSILERDRSEVVNFSNRYEVRTSLSKYLIAKTQPNQDTLQVLLQAIKSESSQIQDIEIVGFDGTILASTDVNRIGESILGENYFVNATTPNQITSILFLEDQKDKTDKLYFSSQISVENKKLGVVIASYSTSELISLVKDYSGLGQTGETILSMPDAEGNAIALTQLRFNPAAGFTTKVTSVVHDKTNGVQEDVVDYRGHVVLASTRNIPLAHWNLTTKIDRDEAFAPIYRLRTNLIIILVLSSCCVIILGLYFARRFTEPILLLIQKTNKIIQGNFLQEIETTSSDEIGILTRSFNKMTAQLAELYRTLEQKVQLKTNELSGKVNDLETTKKAMFNVTEDLQKEKEKIDEQRHVLDSILENLPVGVSLSTVTGQAMLINKTGAFLLGRIVDPKLSNNNFIKTYQFFKGDGTPYPITENPLAIALQTGLPNTKDDIIVHRVDGAQVLLRETSVPIKNHKDQIISVVSVFEDITKEKEVDRMKTEFISLASHQLRTPLSAIKWFTEMLLGGDAGKLTQEQNDFTKNISDSTERMIQLVNSLLNISRIESGRILVDPQPTDVKQLVQGVVNDLTAKIKERNQHLIISVREDLPKINLDPRLIRQVYMNLLTNAIKYTPKGGEITVFVSRKGEELISQVTDNGYGIPKLQQSKIFQKFFRAENIIKVETDGTGLGLYLIKSIIESSRGKIWFESEEGKGTTFWFSLPISGMTAHKGEVTLDS